MFIITLAIFTFSILKGEFFDCFFWRFLIFFCKFYYTRVFSFNYKFYNQDEIYSFILLAIKQQPFSWEITKHSAFNFIDHWIWIQMKVFYHYNIVKRQIFSQSNFLAVVAFLVLVQGNLYKWKWICQGFVYVSADKH